MTWLLVLTVWLLAGSLIVGVFVMMIVGGLVTLVGFYRLRKKVNR